MKINSFFSSCFKLAIITDSARASLRDFFHAQIGQKRFLHVFPLCCFFFSNVSSATIIMNVLHSFTSSNVFSESRFSDTSFSIKSVNTHYFSFFFVVLSVVSFFFLFFYVYILFLFFLFFTLYLLIQFKKFKYQLLYERYLTCT